MLQLCICNISDNRCHKIKGIIEKYLYYFHNILIAFRDKPNYYSQIRIAIDSISTINTLKAAELQQG